MPTRKKKIVARRHSPVAPVVHSAAIAVGDPVVIDGIRRVVTRLEPEKGRVHFGAPADASEGPSRTGTTAAAELRWLDAFQAYSLPGRELEPTNREPAEGEVIVTPGPAEARLRIRNDGRG